MRVQQVLINLLSNAIKFSPKNSHIIVELSTSIAEQPEDLPDFISVDSNQSEYHTWRLSVRDFGIGINDQDQKNLF